MPTENLAGRSVGDFRLVERIGEGGTATVYKAEQSDGSVCAVKILKERFRGDETAVKRFLREAGYGARVDHRSVARTYKYGEADDLYYLALEWVNGVPLSKYISSTGRIDPPVVADIVGQIAGAIDASHAAGIIHRDLKPDNIMYDPETNTAKLLDFGIARDAQLDPAERLTRAGFFVGTLQYVAPEALSGELVGESADTYSLAKITYHMLTATNPHQGRSPRELFQQLLQADPIPLNQAVRGVRFPAALQAAVMRGLARRPADRQPTVLDFARQVAESASQEPGGSRILERVKGLFARN